MAAAAALSLTASRASLLHLLRLKPLWPSVPPPNFSFRRRAVPLLRRRCSSSQSSPQIIAAPNLDDPSCATRNVVDILQERGLVDSITSESLRSACSNASASPLKVYCGFDPTAESLHLGNLLGIIVLSWFQRCGHKAVALIGGATGRVGDPSGKSLERPELDLDTLERNTAGIKDLISEILGRKLGNEDINADLEAKPHKGSIFDDSFEILNNYDWWKDIKFLDFLREVGRFARVGIMMAKESVKRRLTAGEGMSFTEFTYQLLQGYDFLYLFKNLGVNVQIGGSDQWGNITAGTELIRKILRVEGAYGLTFPLLLKSDGTKFGKSEDGAIWLTAAMLSPYKFYQYFFSIPDIDVIRFLKMLTFLSVEEIEELEKQMKKPGYVSHTAQRILAEEVTRFVHGDGGLAEALKANEALRPGAETQLDAATIEGIMEDLDAATIEGIMEDVPSCSNKPIAAPYLDSDFSATCNVFDILHERGLVEFITNESLRSACSNASANPLKVYCGFDPTAEILHLGNLLGIIVLSWFQRCGHKAVALIGGATGHVGDPSGKSLERPELDLDTLERNTAGIKDLISKILGRKLGNKDINADLEAKPHKGSIFDDSFVIWNNYEWWKDIKLLDFLREVGRFARVDILMAKESVKRRLTSEQGMSYTEFTYQLLQGYDFLYLFKNMGVNVQIGGSDQWGNITAGAELIQKILQVEGVYGLTFPLLLKSDGTKFGKSEDGATWLSVAMLSPFKFYQYLFSIPDIDVVRFLKILTFLSVEEIEELEEQMKKPGYVPNTAQRRLAEEVTHFVHGDEGLAIALKVTEALRPGAETQLDAATIEAIAEDNPSCSLPYEEVLNSSLIDLSVYTGLLASKSAARRLVKQGGLYLNKKRVDTEEKRVEGIDIFDGKLLLSAGWKSNMVVRIS